MSQKYRILVDMDGPLADFDKKLVERWKENWPNDPVDMWMDREEFEIHEVKNFASDAEQKLNQIYRARGFYSSLEPIMNGLGFNAIRQMARLGHEVYILSSAGSKAMYAPSEKFMWVWDHIGPEWVSKLIISRNKHIVSGDFLIDDKPNPNGEEYGADWEHIIYDRSFNRSDKNKRRLTWNNWQEVLPELLG